MPPLPADSLLAGGGPGGRHLPGCVLSRKEQLSRAAVFQALARGASLDQVLEEFGITRQELQDLFQKVADAYRRRETGFWRLYCDGASRGNPGPAGAGALLYDPGGTLKGQLSQYLGETTNNVAEYQALILGLQMAREQGATRVQVLADSQLIVEQLKGSYRVKSPHLQPLYHQAQKELQSFAAYAISHVPRAENTLADGLANQGIDQKPPHAVK
ncbi:MAG: ribonuclease HI family protein [Syntrophales bacterium]|nr:ribonuclease HI family protein [Syntrophales bacterium]MDD5641511.1 ribonuclease HI family protein [Syntrophales bacterium]